MKGDVWRRWKPSEDHSVDVLGYAPWPMCTWAWMCHDPAQDDRYCKRGEAASWAQAMNLYRIHRLACHDPERDTE